MPSCIHTQKLPTPAGLMVLGSYGDRLCLCDWADGQKSLRILHRVSHTLQADVVEGDTPVIRQAIRELNEYFARQRTTFTMPLLFAGTDFQRRVWQRLLSVPYGQTLSYGQMAASLGCPNSVRAVANANGANAISIFAPCHRVIGSNGMLTGYGGGLAAKRYLLDLEQGGLFF